MLARGNSGRLGVVLPVGLPCRNVPSQQGLNLKKVRDCSIVCRTVPCVLLRRSWRLPTLLDVEHQTFEVFALGVIDVDGVILGLGQLVHNAHAATCNSCG